MNDASAAVQIEIERNYRHNFLVNAIDGASYWFGLSFISVSIILPLYVSHFTSNPLIIGLIPFINTAGFLLPQLFTANFVERSPIKKWWPVNLGFFLERVPVFLLPASAYFLATNHPLWAMVAFFLLYAWYSGGAGLIIVGWQDMVAKIIPMDRRGRFFGITNFIGNASGILGALAVTFVLDRFTFPMGYVLSFGAAAVLILISWIALSQTREPPVQSNKPTVSQLAYLRTLPQVVRKDRNFLLYLLAQIVYALSLMASGFLMVYSAQTWNLPDAMAGGYVLAMQIGQAGANLFFGFLSDRKGHKLALEIAFLVNAVSLVLAVFATGPAWFYGVFFLRGATIAGTFISGIAIVFEFTGAEDRPTYIGMANTIPGVAGTLAPLIGGWVVGSASYEAMFILALVVGCASLLMLHFTVREPRKAAADEPEIEPLEAREGAPGV